MFKSQARARRRCRWAGSTELNTAVGWPWGTGAGFFHGGTQLEDVLQGGMPEMCRHPCHVTDLGMVGSETCQGLVETQLFCSAGLLHV